MHVVTGRCQVWVGSAFPLRLDNGSKHVEPSANIGIINSITRLHLFGYFYWFILQCMDPSILKEDKYTYLIISHSFLLRMRMVSEKNCRKNQNTYIRFSNFFLFKLCCSWNKMEKCCRARQATDDNMMHAHCMLDT